MQFAVHTGHACKPGTAFTRLCRNFSGLRVSWEAEQTVPSRLYWCCHLTATLTPPVVLHIGHPQAEWGGRTPRRFGCWSIGRGPRWDGPTPSDYMLAVIFLLLAISLPAARSIRGSSACAASDVFCTCKSIGPSFIHLRGGNEPSTRSHVSSLPRPSRASCWMPRISTLSFSPTPPSSASSFYSYFSVNFLARHYVRGVWPNRLTDFSGGNFSFLVPFTKYFSKVTTIKACTYRQLTTTDCKINKQQKGADCAFVSLKLLTAWAYTV